MAEWTSTTPAQLVKAHLDRPANTARGYAEDLRALAAWMRAPSVKKAVADLLEAGRGACKRKLLAWITDMRTRTLAGNTIRRRVAAVTSLVSLAADLEVVDWQIGKLPLPPAVRVRDCTGPGRDVVARMFIACEARNDRKGCRDLAMMALLYWHGLRASEVLSIRVRDVDLEARTVRIVGKRGQGRVCMSVCIPAAKALSRWVDVRTESPGPLFTSCFRGAGRDDAPLTYEGLREVIGALGVKAGGRCWPHALRHSAITHLGQLTNESPLWGCALSRHSSIRTWAAYQDRRISNLEAAEVLAAGRIVRTEPRDRTDI